MCGFVLNVILSLITFVLLKHISPPYVLFEIYKIFETLNDIIKTQSIFWNQLQNILFLCICV